MSTEQSDLSVGEGIVAYLEAKGVSTVFGIPGVHTIDLYRGLGNSTIRHVTPRHEQGAGFMADGYARASGQVGVAFVITGPGVTNIITAMAQARADSIPMLVVSSVNEGRYLGQGLGHLHELPDQLALCRQVALRSEQLDDPAQLTPVLESLFAELEHGRPGPVHLQVPLDVLAMKVDGPITVGHRGDRPSDFSAEQVEEMAARLSNAERPVIVAGGGSISASADLQALAEALHAPVVQTINARGEMHGHPLRVPASPSLQAVRDLLAEADTVLAIGTELGPTDFDVYNTGTYPELPGLLRIDIDPKQLERHRADQTISARGELVLPELVRLLESNSESTPGWGAHRAEATRTAARAELSPKYRHLVSLVETVRDQLPGSIIVGDSTQLLYAANLYYGHDSRRGWFNSSVGFGALGYAIPASIGAALGAPERPIVCLIGDGGAQFTLPELMTAVDENLPIIVIVWNNFAYEEIADAMRSDGAEVVGCDPTPPDFTHLARACSVRHRACSDDATALASVLAGCDRTGPVLIEIQV